MADVLTPEQRRKNMSHIKSKDTSIEIRLRKALFQRGFRYRKNVSNLPGKPDIVLPKYKTIVFVHGCFWHRHEGCRYAAKPSTRVAFWEEKFKTTIRRDKSVQDQLTSMGWTVLIVWECELRNDIFQETVDKLEHAIHARSC